MQQNLIQIAKSYQQHYRPGCGIRRLDVRALGRGCLVINDPAPRTSVDLRLTQRNGPRLEPHIGQEPGWLLAPAEIGIGKS